VLVWCGDVWCDKIHHYIASGVWHGTVLHGIVWYYGKFEVMKEGEGEREGGGISTEKDAYRIFNILTRISPISSMRIFNE
jgi:hypothetical protein